MADLELQTTFAELQSKVIDTQQKVKLADVWLEQLNRMKTHAHLTDKEIIIGTERNPTWSGVCFCRGQHLGCGDGTKGTVGNL
uniref:Uncharacterized protein n=1 Tax=Felis catus TaxID=9685 RepID=A0ABI7YLL3_FELCA